MPGKSSHEYAVILAGGGGSRLWPVSRKSKPKQFQSLIGDKSLLQMMYSLLSEYFPPERVFVQSVIEYLPNIEEQLPHLGNGQIIIEPEARDTAPAFAFAAATLARRDPEAILGIFYADNVVLSKSEPEFLASMKDCFNCVHQMPSHALLMGVRPAYPHTGLGYIEVGERLSFADVALPVFKAKSFVEKPDLEAARRLSEDAKYLWNTGYKVIAARQVLALLANSHPAYNENIPRLQDAVCSGDAEAARSWFVKLPRQSFEYLITENADNLLVGSLDLKWSDLGDWDVIHRILGDKGVADLYTAGRIVKHNCRDTILISQHRPVVAIGVEDLVVIETKDAILVMSKKHSQELKKVLTEELFPNQPELL